MNLIDMDTLMYTIALVALMWLTGFDENGDWQPYE